MCQKALPEEQSQEQGRQKAHPYSSGDCNEVKTRIYLGIAVMSTLCSMDIAKKGVANLSLAQSILYHTYDLEQEMSLFLSFKFFCGLP